MGVRLSGVRFTLAPGQADSPGRPSTIGLPGASYSRAVPTPVPLKILSRRHQRNRLIIALLFALGVGITVHAVRPAPTTGVRYEVLGALALLSVTFLMLLLGLRRIAFGRAAAVLVIEGTALWVFFAVGVLIVGRQNLDEVVAVTAIFWASTVLPGLVVLSIIQHLWPPCRSLTCPDCEYDLRESTSSVCTECGNRFEATCGLCGCALQQIAPGTCPDCRGVLTPY